MGKSVKYSRSKSVRRVAHLVLAGFLISGCDPDVPDTEVIPEVKTTLPALAPAPLFDADSAYAFVAKQVDFGPRVPGTSAHKACGDWMIAKLKAFQRYNELVKLHAAAQDELAHAARQEPDSARSAWMTVTPGQSRFMAARLSAFLSTTVMFSKPPDTSRRTRLRATNPRVTRVCRPAGAIRGSIPGSA
mgnify:CR=1 FL=1